MENEQKVLYININDIELNEYIPPEFENYRQEFLLIWKKAVLKELEDADFFTENNSWILDDKPGKDIWNNLEHISVGIGVISQDTVTELDYLTILTAGNVGMEVLEEEIESQRENLNNREYEQTKTDYENDSIRK